MPHLQLRAVYLRLWQVCNIVTLTGNRLKSIRAPMRNLPASDSTLHHHCQWHLELEAPWPPGSEPDTIEIVAYYTSEEATFPTSRVNIQHPLGHSMAAHPFAQVSISSDIALPNTYSPVFSH